MTQLHVSIRPRTVDIFSTDVEVFGILTNEDPTSSYGIPIILVNGTPLGANEIAADQEIFAHYKYSPAVSPELYETDKQISQRRNPAQVALVHAGITSGYPIAN